MGLFTALAAALGLAAVQYVIAERAGRGSWKALAAYQATQGPYRASTIALAPNRAPRRVRVGAFICILLGELGVLAHHRVEAAIPIAAAFAWALGYLLLLRPGRRAKPEPRPAPKLPRWLVRLLQRKRRRTSLG
jgi:hypothetical protein